jgi:hypothetical protein
MASKVAGSSVDVAQRHAAPMPRQELGRGAADAAARTRHHGHPVA